MILPSMSYEAEISLDIYINKKKSKASMKLEEILNYISIFSRKFYEIIVK